MFSCFRTGRCFRKHEMMFLYVQSFSSMLFLSIRHLAYYWDTLLSMNRRLGWLLLFHYCGAPGIRKCITSDVVVSDRWMFSLNKHKTMNNMISSMFFLQQLLLQNKRIRLMPIFVMIHIVLAWQALSQWGRSIKRSRDARYLVKKGDQTRPRSSHVARSHIDREPGTG